MRDSHDEAVGAGATEPRGPARRPAGMLQPRRALGTLVVLIVAVMVAACGAGSGATPPPTGEPSSAPSSGGGGGGSIDHPTGATDVILRYEEGGGFVMPAFAATLVPHFTLYGDGTVIFRNPMLEPPPAEGSVLKMNPLRTAKLSEEQVQELLALALGEGGLAGARPEYGNDMVADASTALFSINAGGIEKTVSVYALGLDVEGMPDAPARAAFARLAQRLTDFDQGGTIPTEAYEPTGYRGILFDGGGMVAPDQRAWPWPDIAPADFAAEGPADQPTFPSRLMTAEEIDALGVTDYQGGFQGMVLVGPGDGKTYTFSLRPILPDESA